MCVVFTQIREDIHHHGIHIYPSAYPHEDDEDAQASAKYEVSCARLTSACGDVLVSYVGPDSFCSHWQRPRAQRQ